VAMFKVRGGGDEEAAATGAISKVPQSRLVILPATSHIAISAVVQVLEPMITAFLDDVPPANHRFGDLTSWHEGAFTPGLPRVTDGPDTAGERCRAPWERRAGQPATRLNPPARQSRAGVAGSRGRLGRLGRRTAGRR
jgi:hypothetical protein